MVIVAIVQKPIGGITKTGNWEAFSRASTDNGETFNDAVMLKSLGTAAFKLIAPPRDSIVIDSLVTSGNNQYVCWDNKTGNHEVQFAKSANNGKTFENTMNISDSPTHEVSRRKDRC